MRFGHSGLGVSGNGQRRNAVKMFESMHVRAGLGGLLGAAVSENKIPSSRASSQSSGSGQLIPAASARFRYL